MESDFCEYTDDELAELAQKGNRKAEESLLERYKGLARMTSKKYFITGGDREDVVQEGMIGLFEAVRDYRTGRGGSFRSFAELCVNRQIISAIRRANREKHRMLNESVSLEGMNRDAGEQDGEVWTVPASVTDADPQEMILVDEVVSFLRADGIEIFSKLENEVWTEFRKGKTYRKIAEDLGKDLKSVDNAIQRIRRKIYQYLEY